MKKINKINLHEYSNLWIQLRKNIAIIGIDNFFRDKFGEIIYIDLPIIGKKYIKDSEICIIESVKTISEIYTPFSGEIISVNKKLLNKPKLVNKCCYNNSWICNIKINNLK